MTTGRINQVMKFTPSQLQRIARQLKGWYQELHKWNFCTHKNANTMKIPVNQNHPLKQITVLKGCKINCSADACWYGSLNCTYQVLIRQDQPSSFKRSCATRIPLRVATHSFGRILKPNYTVGWNALFFVKAPPTMSSPKKNSVFCVVFFSSASRVRLVRTWAHRRNKKPSTPPPQIFLLPNFPRPPIFLYHNFSRLNRHQAIATCIKSLEWSKTRRKPNRRTRDKPQWIVAQRPLSALTIPGSTLLVFQGFHGPSFEPFISLAHSIAPSKRTKAGAWLYTENDSPIKHRITSMDSDLEAFSRNPSDGSFAALSFLITALPAVWTYCSSRTKFDCCRDIQLISRVKLTCLTTV